MDFNKELFIKILSEKLKPVMKWDDCRLFDDPMTIVLRKGISQNFIAADFAVIIRIVFPHEYPGYETTACATIQVNRQGNQKEFRTLKGRFKIDQESLTNMYEQVAEVIKRWS